MYSGSGQLSRRNVINERNGSVLKLARHTSNMMTTAHTKARSTQAKSSFTSTPAARDIGTIIDEATRAANAADDKKRFISFRKGKMTIKICLRSCWCISEFQMRTTQKALCVSHYGRFSETVYGAGQKCFSAINAMLQIRQD